MRKILPSFTILFGVLFLISACSSADSDTAKAQKIVDYNKQKFNNLPLSGKIIDGARVIEVKGSQYEWSPDNIVVKKGEKIILIIESTDVPHGFEIEGIVIPGWNPDNLISKGQKVTLEFTPEEAGVWNTVCSGYCGPGHVGMKRNFIVRE